MNHFPPFQAFSRPLLVSSLLQEQDWHPQAARLSPRLTKSMDTMVSAVEFSDSVSITMEAGMSRVKLPGSKLTTGGSVAMIRTMKGWDKM